MKIIEVKNLKKSFKNSSIETQVLKGINLECNQGEICVLLGSSGSGKTTLLNLISGLDKPTSGEVLIENTNISNFNDKKMTLFRRNNIGFVFQQYNLIKELSVFENVNLSASLVNLTKNVDEILDYLGLEDNKKMYPQQLSGGMQQRVAIARAIVKEPKILFCDEPTGALDEKSGRDVLSLLKDLNESKNTTIFMITHNPHIAKMAHQVIHIKDGLVDKVYRNESLIDPKDIEWG